MSPQTEDSFFVLYLYIKKNNNMTIKFERITSLKNFKEIDMDISEGISIEEFFIFINNLDNDWCSFKIKHGYNIIKNRIGLFIINHHFDGNYDSISKDSYKINFFDKEEIQWDDNQDYFFWYSESVN